MKVFNQGDRVSTPQGNGSVVYSRMGAPDYNKPIAYSVCLDKKKAESEQPPFPSYSGTIIPADQVTEEKV